jgi:hypothetical protein
MKRMILWIALFFPIHCFPQWRGRPVDFIHGNIKVSDNGRFLQHADGTPFFYLGDTAWELFHRLNRQDADYYLTDRATKGFTVIQAVALAEFAGLSEPNAYGHLPLENLNPAQPAVKEGVENDYWDHVDYIVDKANELGMYIGFLPTWGYNWHNDKPLFSAESAYRYGYFLGQRYRDKQIIWILGGDRNIENDRHREVIRSMARGLKDGDGGIHLITFHPSGGRGSAEWFHNEEWLDFNMRQNGHNVEYTNNYSKTFDDYCRVPAKPVMDGEPLYEDHPISFNAAHLGHSIAADVRRAFYWDIFNGAFGHTYGNHAVWQMYEPESRVPINNPLMSWKEALSQSGAAQMIYGRLLMESRPFMTRIPDASVILPDKVPTAVPGEGRYRFAATRDEAGTYVMVYVPAGRPFTIRTDMLNGKKIKAWWFNPCNGKATHIRTFLNDRKTKTFIPPEKGESIDRILVLDADGQYPPPGKTTYKL